jgi:hypothetical protein
MLKSDLLTEATNKLEETVALLSAAGEGYLAIEAKELADWVHLRLEPAQKLRSQSRPEPPGDPFSHAKREQ